MAVAVRRGPAPGGSDSRATRWGRRVPPIFALIAAVVVVITVFPSTFNLPQSNPTETAEYAPVPPQDNSQPPPQQNVNNLGLTSSNGVSGGNGTGGSGGGGGGGGGGPTPAPAEGGLASSSTSGQTPTRYHCVNGRQTFDELAPPCVPYFTGNNFGATATGVTASEIRVLVYMDGPSCNIYSTPNTEGDLHFDFDKSIQDSSSDPTKYPEQNDQWAPTLRVIDRYFNEYYQMYNRHIHMMLWYGRATSSGGCPTAAERQADAAEEYAAFKPFAEMSFIFYSNEEAYLEYMAQHGVETFIPTAQYFFSDFDTGVPQAELAKYPGLLWSYIASLENNAQWEADAICKMVAPFKVSFSGNPTDTGKARVFGISTMGGSANPLRLQYANQIASDMSATCGAKVVDIAISPSSNEDQYFQQKYLEFRQKGITTVLWPGSGDRAQVIDAQAVGYSPEWLIGSNFENEVASASRGNECPTVPSECAHAMYISEITSRPSNVATENCEQAANSVAPNFNNMGNFCMFYPNFRLMATGFQVAGPRLNEQTVDQGFHAIPHVALNSPYVPTCYFNPNDYTCIKDMQIGWWDNTQVDNGGNPGCYRAVMNGKRWLEGNFPKQDIFSLENSTSDPCTNT